MKLVSDDSGRRAEVFRNDSDLFIIGNNYHCTFRAKSVNYTGVLAPDNAAGSTWIPIINPSMTSGWQNYEFTFTQAANNFADIRTPANTAIGIELDLDNIIIKEVVPEIVNTSTTIVRDVSVYSARFDGADSMLDLGDYNSLIGDITIFTWIKASSWGETNVGRLLANGRFDCRLRLTSNNIFCTSNNSTNAQSGTFTVDGTYCFIAITRTSTGITNIYFNGTLSGSGDQYSGTPVAGSNIFIGNLTGGNATFDGNIPVIKVIQGIATTKQIENYYNSTKRYFGK